MSMTATRPRLHSLQAGRAIAAGAVLASHAVRYAQAFDPTIPKPMMDVFAHGYLGVDFFFVLSGFIIHYTSVSGAGQANWLSRYAKRRLLRIYIPYLPVGIAVALLYAWIPGFASPFHHWSWFSTLTLLPSGSRPALDVAWTLQHEVLFYAFYGFAFLFLSGRWRWLAYLAWPFLILLTEALALAGVRQAAAISGSVALSPINLEFFFGIAAAWLVLRGGARRPWLFVLLGLGAMLSFFVFDVRSLSPLFGLGLALLLAPIASADLGGAVTLPRWLIVLGDASYSIYLVHYPIMALLLFTNALGGLHWSLCLALLGTISLAAGLAYHRYVEAPALRRPL